MHIRDSDLLSVSNKVPQVTFAFWIIKIAATTLGETGGDALLMTLNRIIGGQQWTKGNQTWLQRYRR
jgi:uncharacterized membrane-anchored protein